jgi:FkbM family methyltransferase
MDTIIDRDYIFDLVDRITRPAPYQGPDPLFRMKQKFPAWLRGVVFSWANPFYLGYIYRQALRERKELNYRMRNPFTVSFMTYCFREEFQLNLHTFYPEEDHPTLERYVENRVKSLFVDRLPVHAFCSEPGVEKRIRNAMKGVVKEHRDGSCSWKVGNKKYYIANRPEISASVYHLGLPRLPVEVLDRLAGQVFIDGGAYNGDTAIALLPYGPMEIWCFEPDLLNLDLLNQTIRHNRLESALIPFQLGIGEKNHRASFTHSGIMGSKIGEEGNSEIEVRTIDSVVKERKAKVGLIKLDIEGLELEALRGASHTIRKHKPILIISAYHTGKDFFEIPPLLKALVPDYTLRFFDLEPLSPMLGEKMIIAYAS